MRRHRLDPISFVAGLVFIALAMTAVTEELGFTLSDFRWIAAGGLLLLGALLLITSTTRSRNRP
jgi:hypothetical protein